MFSRNDTVRNPDGVSVFDDDCLKEIMTTAALNLVILGADTLLGETVLDVLGERGLSLASLTLLGGEDSSAMVTFAEIDYPVLDMADHDFVASEVVLVCTDRDTAASYVSDVLSAGGTVLDLSDHGRSLADAVVVQAEHDLASVQRGALLATPSAISSLLRLTLQPLAQIAGLEALSVTALLPVSDSGRQGVEELAQQTRALFSQQEIERSLYEKRIAFNLLPVVGELAANGDSSTEAAMVADLRAAFGDDLAVAATALRAPLFYGDSAVVSLSTREPLSQESAKAALQAAAGVYLLDGIQYGTPQDSIGGSSIWVSRLRIDASRRNGLTLCLSADNLRRGLALNAAQIVEHLATLDA